MSASFGVNGILSRKVTLNGSSDVSATWGNVSRSGAGATLQYCAQYPAMISRQG